MMPNCSNSCATVQNQGGGISSGTGIILRGGDTWHFGNSGATPYTGGTWNFNTGPVPEGTSTHPIYLGVDQSWYGGSSWARPILTGDNPICNLNSLSGTCVQNTNSALDQTVYVTSCPYQNGSSNNRLIDLDWVSYYITDNFELTGLCEMSPGQPGHYDDYIDLGSIQGPQWFTNDYIHGWSHLSFGGANGSAGCTGSTVCFNIFAFDGSTISGGPPNESYLKVVIDGSDSDPGGAGFCFGGAYNTAYSAILYTSQCVAGDFHLFHDNIYSEFYENGHSNMLESNNQAETAGTNAFYNNVLYALETTGGTGGYGIALSPPVGTTDYIFNNVWWNVGGLQNAVTVSSSNSQGVGALVVFNNTFQLEPGLKADIVSCPPANITTSTTLVNNQYITDNSTVFNAVNCVGSKAPVTATNIQMTNAVSNANTSPQFNQYSASEAYVFSPVASTNSTVGTGTNEQSYCSALSTAAGSDSTLSNAASACRNPIPFACNYVTTTHTMSCQATPTASPTAAARPASAAWNIGAYQLSPVSLNPPINAKAGALP
jgi:hypothetical protein